MEALLKANASEACPSVRVRSTNPRRKNTEYSVSLYLDLKTKAIGLRTLELQVIVVLGRYLVVGYLDT